MSLPRPLETERLRLDRFTVADGPALHAIMADPAVMRFWSTPPHALLAETEVFLAATIEAVENGSGRDYAVRERTGGTLLGKAGQWRLGEIGVILARAAWGRGLAFEALRAVCDDAFASGSGALVADIDPRNERCLALFGRLGFVETGRQARTWRVGDEWCDSVYVSLAAPG